MAKNLVIVESPAKAKTIEKFLGKDFKVESSFGHIADLPSKELGVDVDGDFKPKYIVPTDKKALVKNLKSLADKAEMVWLASDEDREGEAIAWHLFEELKLNDAKTKRIVFHEITKTAILKAIENPRKIDYNLVNAQQARRVLDRLVGYELSPVLWKKVKGGLSAGRVQSVSVRLLVEREREIQNFIAEASFRVDAEFLNEEGKAFKAKLPKNLETKKDAQSFLEKNKGATFTVADLIKKPAKKQPSPPFTTSTLQQEASRKLYFPVAKTMNVAQRLYEAGLITYMRTDSVNLSEDAKNAAKAEINSAFGAKYCQTRNFTSKSKGAQEAHEAIRPTDIATHSINIDRDQSRLYELIWKRTIASQMSDAELERTNVRISASTHNQDFTANGEMIKFDGFLKVYLEGQDNEEEEQEGMLPNLRKGEKLANKYITATERFTRPPYRYTEASLVKQLEELGIGRPSTYAPTISTIQNRNYAEKGTIEGAERSYLQLTFKKDAIVEKTLTETVGSDKGKLVPTDIGMIVNDFLVENFKTILDYNFTAKVEQDFDDIAEGNEKWTEMLRDFYKEFHIQVKDVEENAERESGERILGKHPETGRIILVRLGKYGAMAQIGAPEEEDKLFASLRPDQQLNSITIEEVLDLFKLPKKLGQINGEDVEVNNGRFGPYVRVDKMFISLPKGIDPLDVTLDQAKKWIAEKKKADAPIYEHDGLPVQKGVGRFGPFLKWNNMFINVNKKYDFDNLSVKDIVTLIEEKVVKEEEKVLKDWPKEGIRIEKARWGRFHLLKGKTKIELPKNTEVEKITLEEAKAMLDKKAPASKKTIAKKKAPLKKKIAPKSTKKK
ncbi:MAG: type I DNA topoisomerase [Flavobacteriaceae bacterium CG_4_8_14_3_um_filter_34_10]|nr:type I DNA topoisomerase [Flavobacteriia bacterium]OIP51046.1 MAG: DNA topoisomerase I [Flavobacteriaceae bacterium CG2_30_34_30]PIQ19070.1 MAG: DNA topoisomerase I [Flavobacteriaceae bacterium CG18_big_fil_WC_8_21_14_2_50_34_36]PIV49302.1 MAG: type I DNA topoisomerase [Flavobacteriaceae bacterium CG02_land_8_20_14_3_00_34_13]PIX10618.1 MAG: type I DNA topoisomerase [Flavobacteriaceae bacterium CG_4_8_14_3_um_filter_34_10]PIZ07976.1 MAG: type I DNA topoisomerase [Flavobacteriaceae bacterium